MTVISALTIFYLLSTAAFAPTETSHPRETPRRFRGTGRFGLQFRGRFRTGRRFSRSRCLGLPNSCRGGGSSFRLEPKFRSKNDPNTFWERSMLLPGTCIFLRLKSQLDFVHLGACCVWSFDYESRSGYKLDIQIMSTYSQIDVALMTQIPIIIHTWRLLGHTLNKVTSSVTNFVVSLSYWTSTITQQKSRMSCIILLTSVNVTLLLCLPSTNIWPVDDPYQSFGSKLSRYITAASTITYRANINYHLEYR